MTTTEQPWADGTPCWVDLVADDFDTTCAFYAEVLGWQIPAAGPAEFGGYATATRDGKTVAGLMPRMDPSQPTAWTTYLATSDLDTTVGKVREAGGQVLMDAADVGDMGRMAVMMDPGGTSTGLWQAGSHVGFQLANEPGSVTWNENYSRDWEANKSFYASVFGWTYDDMSSEGFSYATFTIGDRPGGAVAPVDEGMAPHWNVYFQVDDADAAVAAVTRLGGSVVRDPSDTEFGRMAAVTDAQGSAFMVMSR